MVNSLRGFCELRQKACVEGGVRLGVALAGIGSWGVGFSSSE